MTEHDDTYHVRPFPQQPHRGGKELITALAELEGALSDKVPDPKRLRLLQERVHKAANTCNDDRLVDMIRILSEGVDHFQEKPGREALEKILQQILKVRVELKHL